jgi:phosphatidate phosphatase PAH1
MLRGVTDVVVIKQKDGSFKSTPFYVHFNKKDARRKQDEGKILNIKINNVEINHLKMQLDDRGDAYFANNEYLEKNLKKVIKTDKSLLKKSASLNIILDESSGFNEKTENFLKQNKSSEALEATETTNTKLDYAKKSKKSIFRKKEGSGKHKKLKIDKSVESVSSLTSLNSSNEPNSPVEFFISTEPIQKSHKSKNYDKNSNLITKAQTLTSEQLEKLNLNPGVNEISYGFDLESKRLVACIYLWNYDDKLVVCDIDGTVTKSDFRGQVLQFLGKNWSHGGVAELFSGLDKNSYKVIYLSARSYVEAKITRSMLANINQNGTVMPRGPVLLNPSGLIESIQSELISKDSYLFKIDTLVNVKSLFDDFYNPFYAGFGNRLTDADAYRKVGISDSLIFITNQLGKINYDPKASSHLTYKVLLENVHGFFPNEMFNLVEEITYC